jgi:protein-disulfide isomerase
MGGRHLVQSAVPMFLKISAITVLALLSLSPPQSQADEIAALKQQIQELQTHQTSMERDLQAIKSILQEAQARQQAQAPAGDPFVSKTIAIANEPTRGNAAAKITIVEVSDYHCPFCRRQTLQTLPQLMTDYVNSGKVKYVFVDYPIAQLHPDAFQSHEAADCAGDQGKYWQMHDSLFANPPAKDDAALTALARAIGANTASFTACLASGRHAAPVQASVARMEQLGIGGTPMTLIGLTPAPGQPMKVVSFVYGARPYADFKAAIEQLLR